MRTRAPRALVLAAGVALGTAGLSGAWRPRTACARPASDASVLADPSRPLAARLDAARGLSATPPGPARDEAVRALAGALEDAEPELRMLVAEALGHLGEPRVLPALVRRLPQETDARALAAVLLAIGRLGGPAETSVVAPFAGHAESRLRAAAAIALGDLGGAAAHARLLALLAAPGEDPEWAVRGAAMLALAKTGVRADAGTILVVYRDEGGAKRWFARAALATAMAALDSDPVPLLDRLAGDEDARVSSAAVAAFARAGRPEEVVRRLADPRVGVRAAAAAAVGQARIEAAIPSVRAMATGDPDRGVRLSAAIALSRLDDPTGDELLVEALDADDPAVWTLALAELRRRTGLLLGRDPARWKAELAARRRAGAR